MFDPDYAGPPDAAHAVPIYLAALLGDVFAPVASAADRAAVQEALRETGQLQAPLYWTRAPLPATLAAADAAGCTPSGAYLHAVGTRTVLAPEPVFVPTHALLVDVEGLAPRVELVCQEPWVPPDNETSDGPALTAWEAASGGDSAVWFRLGGRFWHLGQPTPGGRAGVVAVEALRCL